MITILHVQLLPMLSGVQRVSLNEMTDTDSFSQDDFKFELLCKEAGPLTDKAREYNITCHTVSHLRREISLISDIRALLNLYWIIKKNNYDVVHTHSSKTGFIGRIAAKLAGVPLVVHTVHGYSFPFATSFMTKKLYFVMEYIARFFTDVLIVLNEDDYEISLKQLKFSKSKLEVISNGVDTEKFRPCAVTNDRFRVVMVGRLWRQKNPMCLLLAIELLVSKYSDITVDFIGDGELRNELEQYVNDHNLSGYVNFLGWVEQVDNELPHYDLFVLPSLWEGMPLAILEAQACGLPTIVSNISGNADLVKDGYNGYLFQPNDFLELANKIELIYLNKDLRENLSFNSRSNVVMNYSLEKRNKSIMSVYSSI